MRVAQACIRNDEDDPDGSVAKFREAGAAAAFGDWTDQAAWGLSQFPSIWIDSAKTQRRIVSAWIDIAFAEADAPWAAKQGRSGGEQFRSRVPRRAALMDDAEVDVLACVGVPVPHRAKIHSNNPLGRLGGKLQPRTNIVGILSNEAAVAILVTPRRHRTRSDHLFITAQV